MPPENLPETPPAAPPDAPGGNFRDIQRQLAAHLRDPSRPPPPGLEERRLDIYRGLFIRNIEGFLADAFPVLKTLCRSDDWRDLARRFYARHRCRSPYFSDISREFLDYLENEHEARPCDPPFMLELAHYEWLELALARAEDTADHSAIDRKGDLLAGVPVASPLAWQHAYEWPVHRIGPHFIPREPGKTPTWLVVWRADDDRVRFMELNLPSALLLEKVAEGGDVCGAKLIRRVVAELAVTDTEKALQGGQQTLEMMSAKGIVLGVRR